MGLVGLCLDLCLWYGVDEERVRGEAVARLLVSTHSDRQLSIDEKEHPVHQ